MKRSRRVLARVRTAIKSPTPNPKLIVAHARKGLIVESDREEENVIKMGISFGLRVSATGGNDKSRLAEDKRGRT